MDTLADRLKAARRDAGISQEMLAKRASVSQATIAALETGEHKTARAVARIAGILQVETLWLSQGMGQRRRGDTPVYEPVIPAHVLHLAQQLLDQPTEKLAAVALLLGIQMPLAR